MLRKLQLLIWCCAAIAAVSLASGSVCYDVYIVSGQSNMDGRGDKKDLTGALARFAEPQTDVQICYANPLRSQTPREPIYKADWQPLAPGLAVPPFYSNSLPSERFGPELSFGRALADAKPHCHIALIKVAQGSTSLSKDWNPASNYLYLTLTNTVMVELKKLQARGDSAVLKGMIWHQGESDVKGGSGKKGDSDKLGVVEKSAGAEKYGPRLAEFIKSVRRDLGVADLPFVVGEIATNKDSDFRAMQLKIAKETPHAGFVSSAGLHTAVDGTHFKSASVVELGQRFAAEMLKLNTPETAGKIASVTVSQPDSSSASSASLSRLISK